MKAEVKNKQPDHFVYMPRMPVCPNFSKQTLHIFKKYIYNPTAIVIGYPLFYGKEAILQSFDSAFKDGDNTWHRHFNRNSNDPTFSLIETGKIVLNFKEIFLTIKQDDSLIGFKKYNYFIAQAIMGISAIVTQAVHKIFNYFLPCYLNPAHLLSFFMSLQQTFVQFPMNTFSDGAVFLEYQQDYLYQVP